MSEEVGMASAEGDLGTKKEVVFALPVAAIIAVYIALEAEPMVPVPVEGGRPAAGVGAAKSGARIRPQIRVPAKGLEPWGGLSQGIRGQQSENSKVENAFAQAYTSAANTPSPQNLFILLCKFRYAVASGLAVVSEKFAEPHLRG